MQSIIRTAGLVAVLAGLVLPSHMPAQGFSALADGVAGFGERCAQRRVVCISEADLKSKRSYQLSSILLRAGGLNRRCGPSTSQCALHMKSGTEECSPTYFLDGVVFAALSDDALTQLDKLLVPEDLRGIEVYRSEQRPPAPFDVVSTCGVILLWRRK